MLKFGPVKIIAPPGGVMSVVGAMTGDLIIRAHQENNLLYFQIAYDLTEDWYDLVNSPIQITTDAGKTFFTAIDKLSLDPGDRDLDGNADATCL